MDIIFEDNHLLVVDKPPGLLTQPAGSVTDSLEVFAKSWLKEKYQKPGNVFLGVIHRLDRPVGGLVVLAKTSKALSRLNESLRSKEMKKTYRALVEGKLPQDSGTMEHYLVHDEYRARVCSKNEINSKRAILHYRVIETFNNISLLEIDLETGRYHQIRCQLAYEGFSVLGDAKYGARSNNKYSSDNIALRHIRLSLKHPITSLIFTLESIKYLNLLP